MSKPKTPAPLTILRAELLVDRQIADSASSSMTSSRSPRATTRFEWARVADRLDRGGIYALRHLEDEGDVGVTRLGEHFPVSGSFATTMVGKPIRRGLAAKEPDPMDGRRVRPRVARKGHELLARRVPVQTQVNDVQFGCLSRPNFSG
jgi:DNA-binding MarR family transcriptional regulator